jgi:hypothetical protein
MFWLDGQYHKRNKDKTVYYGVYNLNLERDENLLYTQVHQYCFLTFLDKKITLDF